MQIGELLPHPLITFHSEVRFEPCRDAETRPLINLCFVCVFTVNFLLLLPGLNQHGIITKYASMAKREVNKLLKQKEKKNE